MYPSTYVVDKVHRPGVSKFDFEDWKKDGCPVLGVAGWCALCLLIAKKDLVNLGLIFKTAEQMTSNL